MRRLLIIAVALIAVPSANAAFSLTITTGSPVTAPPATLSGIDQTKNFTIVTSIVNTGGGNGVGWNETALASIPTSAGKVLPALIITTIASGACTGGGCVNPANSVTYPIPLLTTALKVFNASAGSGKGTVALTHTFTITYPSNALPGIYSSVITLALVSGP